MKSLFNMKSLLDMANIPYSNSSSSRTIKKQVTEYLDRYSYAPRYLRGLTEDEKWNKKFDIRYYALLEKQKGISYYKPVETDIKDIKDIKKYSKYTTKWNQLYPKEKTLSQKSIRTGVPLDILQKVDKKGKSAWRGGQHRPGATQAQWGISRVNSFLLCGKTFYFPDHLLAKEAMKRSRKAKKRWEEMGCKFEKMGKRTKSR